MNEFKLDNVEQAAFEKFNKKHYKKCNSGVSAIFTETGIGQKVEVRCNFCLKEKDITNYSTW